MPHRRKSDVLGCVWVTTFAMCLVAIEPLPIGGVATFSDEIAHVVGMRAQEEMVDIDASRDIAPMQHMQTVRNGPMRLFPDDSVQ